MSKEQIEEMAKDIGDSILFDDFDFVMHDKTAIIAQIAAEKLTAKGYRKQSEGEWVWKSNGYMKYLHCSCCGNQEDWERKYCPNCGARMRKEDEGK